MHQVRGRMQGSTFEFWHVAIRIFEWRMFFDQIFMLQAGCFCTLVGRHMQQQKMAMPDAGKLCVF
jgi:hypothetical protein